MNLPAMYQGQHSSHQGAIASVAEPTGLAAMRTALFRLLAIQAVISLAIAVGFYAYRGTPGVAEAALFGGGIGLAVSALLGLRLLRAARPGAGVAGLYLGAMERFAFVAVAFAVGLGVLDLAPVPVLAGFGGAQCAYFIAAKWVHVSEPIPSGSEHGG
ncbi:MAG: ATP synthase subunit I [Steroidobacteraceae bacterium]